MIRAAFLAIALLLSACSPRTEPRDPPRADAIGLEHRTAATDAAGERPGGTVGDSIAPAAAVARSAVAGAAADAQAAVGITVVPVMLDVQEAVQDALPSPLPASHAAPVAPEAVALIVREEIISPAYYTAKLQGFACPGDTSGPTVGIGSDLGVHTPARIRSDWSIHPRVDTLALASGQIGFGKCRAYRSAHADVRTPIGLAQQVFAASVLPAYHALAASAFRNGWDRLPPNAQGALVVTVYARGASMMGAMRTEMRTLRDDCVPRGDLQCIARAHLAMCNRFAGRADGAGLCKRFRATAALAVRT